MHVVKPGVDDVSFSVLRQGVGGKAAKDPLPVLNVAAADHENEGLAALFRDAAEVIVDVGDGLEVDVELDIGGVPPFLYRRQDVGGLNRRTGFVSVDIEQRVQGRSLLSAFDTNFVGREAFIGPAEDTRMVSRDAFF